MKKYILKGIIIFVMLCTCVGIMLYNSPRTYSSAANASDFIEETVTQSTTEETIFNTTPTVETEPVITEPETIATEPAITAPKPRPQVSTPSPSKPTEPKPEPETQPPATEEPTIPETTEPEITEPNVPETEPVVQEEKYPVAREVWNYMKNTLGWNDAVCAGVMGNLMVETGGYTLNLKPLRYNNTGNYYGICQWSLRYYPEAAGMSLTQQLNLLKNTVQKEINTFGKCYYSGFNYSKFIALNNAQDAALAFAKCYERCSQSSYNYSKRQQCAIVAYNYFVG